MSQWAFVYSRQQVLSRVRRCPTATSPNRIIATGRITDGGEEVSYCQ
jgi:hypothetical protein